MKSETCNCNTMITVRDVSLDCTGQGTGRLVLFLTGFVLFAQCELPHAVLHIFHALDLTGGLWNSSFLSYLFSVVLSLLHSG
jgi:hypothetical protein